MTDPAPPVPRVGIPSATSPGRRAVRALAGAMGYVAFVVLLVVVVVDGSLHRTSRLGDVERQPASVNYEDGSTHYAGLVHTRSWVFGRHQSYELYTGRYPDLGYGHFVRLGFGLDDQRPVIADATWDEKGVRVTFTSGHEVFVPARHFVGGR
ncbi:hypothetical protein ACQPZP_19430 [Spirillospora sp. CA-142024]|uniref:hypothetical protein n=1 Tax=Spirillospora sp. CA-142024 TaxID=3240036 RepID=UPI003D9279AC